MIHWTDDQVAALEAERAEIQERLRYIDVLLRGRARRDEDDDPTQKFPPIRDTVHLRRPPPPVVRELGRAELLRALALEIQADGAAPPRRGHTWECDFPAGDCICPPGYVTGDESGLDQ